MNGNLCPTFWQKWLEQRVLPVPAVSQLPTAQNNPYGKLAYFGVEFWTLQLH